MAYTRESVFEKTSAEVLDFVVDWRNWLGTDTVASDAWTVEAGITEDSSAGGVSAQRTIWLSGGTVGTTYSVTNTITTDAGRTAARTIYIEIVTERT